MPVLAGCNNAAVRTMSGAPRQAAEEAKDPKSEKGQSLVEMVVAMALLAAVTALFAQSFVAGTYSSGYARQREVAVTLADSAIDNARAVTSPFTSLLSGTCVVTPPAQVDLSATFCSSSSSQGAYEQTPKTTTLDGTAFTTKVFAGGCYLQSSGSCTLTSNTTYLMIRVIVDVTWTVASTGCTNGCYYVTSSLISNVSDSILNTLYPGVPTGLTATSGNAQVSLSWTDPASNGGSPITSYDVYDGTSSGGESYSGTPACTATGASATSCTVTGLTNGTTYYFTVEAVNAAGNSSSSTETSAVPLTVPGAPTQSTPTAYSGQVTVNWSAPGSNGGSAITGYNVYEATTSGGESYSGTAACTATGASATSCTVTGLAHGTYYFTVEAVNAAGNSAPSNQGSAVPSDAVILSPTSGPAGTSVTISGTGFTGGGTINHSSGVTFAGTSVSIGSSNITVGSSGNWSATFTVPTTAPHGSQTVTATDSSGVSASATFTVQSTITLSPTSGQRGRR